MTWIKSKQLRFKIDKTLVDDKVYDWLPYDLRSTLLYVDPIFPSHLLLPVYFDFCKARVSLLTFPHLHFNFRDGKEWRLAELIFGYSFLFLWGMSF